MLCGLWLESLHAFGNISDNHHIKYTIYREHGKTEAVDGGWTGHSTPLKMLRQDLVVPSI